jgi:hypothetical protein
MLEGQAASVGNTPMLGYIAISKTKLGRSGATHFDEPEKRG